MDTPAPTQCLRCQSTMSYMGTKSFHEGSKLAEAFLGWLGEDRENLDMLMCPHCGHVEFFMEGFVQGRGAE